MSLKRPGSPLDNARLQQHRNIASRAAKSDSATASEILEQLSESYEDEESFYQEDDQPKPKAHNETERMLKAWLIQAAIPALEETYDTWAQVLPKLAWLHSQMLWYGGAYYR